MRSDMAFQVAGGEWQPVFQQDLRQRGLIDNWMVLSGDWEERENGICKTSHDDDGRLMLRVPVFSALDAVRVEYEARSVGAPGDLSLIVGTLTGGHKRSAFFGFGSNTNSMNRILYNGNEVARGAGTSGITPKIWHRITATREGGKLALYVDDKLLVSGRDSPYGLNGPYVMLYAWNPAEFRSIRVWRKPDPIIEALIPAQNLNAPQGVVVDSIEELKALPKYSPDHVVWLEKEAGMYLSFLRDGLASKAPIRWIPPATFDPAVPGMGLPPLPRAEHHVFYDPKPSHASIDEGGDGIYESPMHGTYNHGMRITLYKNYFLVHWSHHGKDEGGPGGRTLATVAVFNDDRTQLTWKGPDGIVELAPAPVPIRRRKREYDPDTILERAADASFVIINDRLYSFGCMKAAHGYSNLSAHHLAHDPKEPIPAKHWSDTYNKETGHTWEIYWAMGFDFVQQWEVKDNRLRPASPIYWKTPMPERIEVTPSRFKEVLPLLEPYASAIPFSDAPHQMRDDVLKGTRTVNFSRPPIRYASSEADTLTVDGTNGLAHRTHFRRPDGKWVVIRDNLKRGWCYYAALRDSEKDVYPPAHRTNLIGLAMPAAGELPDGRPWIIGNARSRKEMYITVSEDGIVFDKTWLILHNDDEPEPDSKGKKGGPQYFNYVIVGDNIWVVYSITKMKGGITRIPISSLGERTEADRE